MKLTIIDVKTKEKIIEHATVAEVSNKIKVTETNIRNAVEKDRVIKNKWYPIREEDTQNKSLNAYPEELRKKWDRTMRGIRIKYNLDMSVWNTKQFKE